jgi:hypothetical protein
MAQHEIRLWKIPGIYRKGEWLRAQEEVPHSVPVDKRIVEEFREIKAPADVEAGARRYGFLNQPPLGTPDKMRERIFFWLEVAKTVRNVLTVAEEMAANSPSPEAREALNTLAGEPCEFTPYWCRIHIGTAVTGLLSLAELRPVMWWSPDLRDWRLSLASPWGSHWPAYSGCLGPLAYFLAHAVMEKRNWVECSVCHHPYPAERAPSKGRHNWCPECRGTPAAWREQKRISKERERASVVEIVETRGGNLHKTAPKSRRTK